MVQYEEIHFMHEKKNKKKTDLTTGYHPENIGIEHIEIKNEGPKPSNIIQFDLEKASRKPVRIPPDSTKSQRKRKMGFDPQRLDSTWIEPC